MKILIANQQKLIKIDRRKIRQVMTRLMKATDCVSAEISITFVDDAAIRILNREYLKRDKPTNVLSFSLQEGEYGDINAGLLGDIIISAETALRDALRGGLTFEEEIIFLLIHGFLHLTGYNHENTSRANASRMRQKEKELFRLLAVND
ncbi:MAG TPA: rRNA maturation RNase YbeY [Smithellaceae bacterium]|nr:rRNA maturation RNase YbeY [Smithellaceae bacterium]